METGLQQSGIEDNPSDALIEEINLSSRAEAWSVRRQEDRLSELNLVVIVVKWISLDICVL